MTNLGCWWWWLVLGGLLGWLASGWLSRGKTVTVEKIVDRPVERVVDRVVEKVVEKRVDNPAHLDRIRSLEAEVATVAGLRATISQLQADAAKATAGASPQTLISSAGLPVPVPVTAPVPEAAPAKPVNRIMDRALDRLLDRQAAQAAGFQVRGMDDLEVIEGIGPQIAALFKIEGIRMFWEMAQTPQLRMQAILDRAGPNFRMANPSTWARQADLAANNKWDMLRTLQDELSAGVDKSGKADL